MIIVFKTHSGQEVICTYEAGTCSKARILHPVPQDNGKLSLALIPYFFADHDGEFSLDSGSYTHKLDRVPKDIEDYYLQQTSGLVLGGMV